MSNGWEINKKWSDKFLIEIKRIIGEYFISEPLVEEDMNHNTDLTILRLDPIRIACRVRALDYYNRYPNDFTIRSGLPSGVKTELAKIIEGWGDYLFYGFSNQAEDHLLAWRIISLNNFRLWHSRELVRLKGIPPGKEIQNYDGSSRFTVFNIKEMPSNIVFKEIVPIT